MCFGFQLLIALRFYACGSFQQVIGDTVGVEKSTVSRIIRRVSLALAQYCEWPSDDRKKKIKSAFFQMAGFPGLVGCIDGTHVRIQVTYSHFLGYGKDKVTDQSQYDYTNELCLSSKHSRITHILEK